MARKYVKRASHKSSYKVKKHVKKSIKKSTKKKKSKTKKKRNKKKRKGGNLPSVQPSENDPLLLGKKLNEDTKTTDQTTNQTTNQTINPTTDQTINPKEQENQDKSPLNTLFGAISKVGEMFDNNNKQ